MRNSLLFVFESNRQFLRFSVSIFLESYSFSPSQCLLASSPPIITLLLFIFIVSVQIFCHIKFIQFQCYLWCIPSSRVILSFKWFAFAIISSTLQIFSLECHFLYFYTLCWSFFGVLDWCVIVYTNTYWCIFQILRCYEAYSSWREEKQIIISQKLCFCSWQ